MTGQNHREPSRFENKLTKYFDDFLNDVGLSRAHGGVKLRSGGTDGKQSTWSPAIDIKENDKEYIVIADVPGVEKEDLDVELHDTLLVISGQNKQDPHNTENTQQIGVDKGNQRSNDPQYHQRSNDPQYRQQSNDPQYRQQSNDPQYHQQSNDPQYHQQSNDPQYHQQSNDPQYHQQSNDPQYKQQLTGQQEPHQYQERKDKQPENQQDRKPPYYPPQPGEQQYYQQQADEQRHHQSDDPHYKQKHPAEEQPYHQKHSAEEQQYQHLPKYRQRTQGERIHIQERPYGYFSRSIQLPSNIKSDDDFHANLSNGVLKIRIPKNNDKPRKKITIS